MRNRNLHITFLITAAIGSLIFSSFNFTKHNWTLVKSFKTSPIQKVSIDRQNSFFVVDDKGNLFKYDSLGNLSLSFSPQKRADIALVEAWRTVNIFIFYRDLQEYNILDRFLTSPTQNFKFKEE